MTALLPPLLVSLAPTLAWLLLVIGWLALIGRTAGPDPRAPRPSLTGRVLRLAVRGVGVLGDLAERR